ncbi:MAG: acetyl-CoA carboxylase biotin carboxyl carrier protein [Saprospiraceae bacterium]|nr:acetyl-CoA carboxylase biotin carboxyl carrier protein [Saprospiraceae bacterium]
MDLKEISELVKLVGKSNLIELKIKDGDFEISLRTEKHGLSKSEEPEKTYIAAPPIAQHPVQVQATPAQPTATAPDGAGNDTGEGAASSKESETDKDYLEIKSPMVGTFYRSSGPDKPPYIKVGDSISQGSVVCIIEAMKLFNEIESEITGKVVKVMVEDATPVEYDQVLFLVER